MNSRFNIAFPFIGGMVVLLSFMVGCSSVMTRRAFLEPITERAQTGNLESAVQMLEDARKKNKYANKDRLLYFIDAGMLNHYLGSYEESNLKLGLAEEAADELFTKSISRAAVSFFLNDNALEYSGEDFEILYTNLFKALNFIAMNDFDSAFVEIRRANLKLENLDKKYADAAKTIQGGFPDKSAGSTLKYNM